jgi:ethanolamine transporter EutH
VLTALLAAGFLAGWSVADLAIAVVGVAAIVALVCVALRYFEIEIPWWVRQVFWICVVTLAVIVAIKFVASL